MSKSERQIEKLKRTIKPKFLHYCGNILIVSGLIYIALGFYPVAQAELGYFLLNHPIGWFNNQTPSTTPINIDDIIYSEKNNSTHNPWEALNIIPVDSDFSIMIPKINVNAPVVTNVSVTEESTYQSALKHGVAHAQNTSLPSNQPGNTYLFAHSTPNIFDIQKYSAVFTLLNKLEPDDLIILAYQDQRYNYRVTTNKVVQSFNLEPLTRQVTTSTLTLQTCDPPGIPINRRIVTAELIVQPTVVD